MIVPRLANTLQTVAPSSSALVAVADQAHVSRRCASLARAGKPINAGACLALCGVVGIDPIDGSSRPVKSVSSDVLWWVLAGALYITRGLRRLDQRNAAKQIGISPSTVCRIEAGRPVSIGSMIRICEFIGVHPDGYTAPIAVVVSRGTGTETRCAA